MNDHTLVNINIWDIMIIVSVMIVCGIVRIVNNSGSLSGDKVQVYVDNELYSEYDLSSDNIIDIQSQNGYNRICINNNEVFMEDADCSDKLCVRQRHIKYDGESIVCLPHGLIITVTADSLGDYDAITQ